MQKLHKLNFEELYQQSINEWTVLGQNGSGIACSSLDVCFSKSFQGTARSIIDI